MRTRAESGHARHEEAQQSVSVTEGSGSAPSGRSAGTLGKVILAVVMDWYTVVRPQLLVYAGSGKPAWPLLLHAALCAGCPQTFSAETRMALIDAARESLWTYNGKGLAEGDPVLAVFQDTLSHPTRASRQRQQQHVRNIAMASELSLESLVAPACPQSYMG